MIRTGILSIRRITASLLVASFDFGVAVRGADGAVAEFLNAGVLKGKDEVSGVGDCVRGSTAIEWRSAVCLVRVVHGRGERTQRRR